MDPTLASLLPGIISGIAGVAKEHMANQNATADQERSDARSTNFSSYGVGGISDPVQQLAQNAASGGRGSVVGSQANTQSVANTAEIIRKQHGLDPITSNLLAQKAHEAASNYNQGQMQNQQAYNYTLGQGVLNNQSQRDLISQGVSAAANNVQNQLTSLDNSRRANNDMLASAAAGLLGGR